MSYRSSEIDFALQLAADLKNAGIAVWMDRYDLRLGENWVLGLQAAVDRATGMICVMSQDYVASGYTRREMTRAMTRGINLLPLLIQDVPTSDWPFEVQGIHYQDFRNWRNPEVYTQQFNHLVERLHSDVYGGGAIPDPEAQYLNCLIAELETRKGVLEQVDSSSGVDVRALDPATDFPGFMGHWSENATFALVDERSETVIYPHHPHGDEEEDELYGIDAVFTRYPRFIIVGAAGSGKTMTLLSLALKSARERLSTPERKPLPFFVKLATWRDQPTAEAFFASRWTLGGDVIERMKRGEVILFCDGLNEMSENGADKIALLRAWLHGERAPKRVVFTCRDDRYSEIDLSLPGVQPHALDDERIRSYVMGVLGKTSGSVLLRRIMPQGKPHDVQDEGARQLFRMARSPFYLSALTLIHSTAPDGELPRNMGALACRLVEVLWARAQSKDIPGGIPFESVRRGLETLAFDMAQSGRRVYLPIGLAEAHLHSAEALRVAVNAGLLDRDNGSVRFHHQLVQDYFAAREMERLGVEAHLPPPRYDANGARMATAWDRAVIALMGCTHNPNGLIRRVLQIDAELAASCLASGIAVHEDIRAEVIIALTNQVALNGRSLIYAARSLMSFEPEAALPLLFNAMRSGEWSTRHEAALIVRTMHLPVRRSLVRALDQRTPLNSLAIAARIRKIGEAALPTLLVLLRHPHWYARRSAAWALGELGDRAAMPDLIEALGDHRSEVGAEAAEAIGLIGDAQGLEALYMLARLQTGLGRRSRLGKAAVSGLVHLGDAALPYLVKLMGVESSPEARRLVGYFWREIDSEDALPTLLELSYHEDLEVRAAALEALGAFTEDMRAVKRLIEALKEMDFLKRLKRRISDIAAEKLEESGVNSAERAAQRWRAGQRDQKRPAISSSATHVKDRLKRDTDEKIAAPAPVLALAAVGASSSGNSEPDFLRETDALVPASPASKGAPAGAASSASAASPIGRLIAALDNADEQVRLSAIQLLAKTPGDAAITALVKALGDFEAVVADAAVEALTAHGAAVVPAVRGAVRDESLNRRAGALEVLCRIQAVAALPELIAVLDDTRRPWLGDRRICDLAAAALERIGTHEALRAVELWRAKQTATVAVAANGEHEDVEKSQDNASKRDDPARYPEILAEMLAALRSDNWGVREETAKDLREFARIKLRGASDPALIDPLTAVLTDPDWVLRWSVVEALAWVGDPGVVTKLLTRLEDENWMVRVAAIRALQEIGDRGAAARIGEMLEDKNATVREAAAEALGKLGDQAAIPSLTLAALQHDPLVRFAAVEALLRIGGDAAVVPISNALNDEEAIIRLRAVQALDELRDPRAIPDLIKRLEDEAVPQWQELRVCDVAADALKHFETAEALSAVEEWKKRQNHADL
ncbi:MAG: HEAT repeat domain-containing protein [Anaerolineae bacterium]|nr:HEAT repeat domain-containing protein [Anaerolineae bacterium]